MIEILRSRRSIRKYEKRTHRRKIFGDVKRSLAALSVFAGDQSLDIHIRR